MADQIESIFKLLEELQQQHELSLLKLSQPLLAPPQDEQQHQDVRVSDASSAADGNTHPTRASLDADLVHYRDLFTKLRFSYTEQVTKEKFLRSLVSDPPAHIDAAFNIQLESSLATLKASLQAQKAVVNDLLADLEAQARSLAQRHSALDEQTAQLAEIPGVVAELRADIARMREEQGVGREAGDGRTEMRLGLEATVELVEEREEKLGRLDERLQEMVEQKEAREGELKRLREEVGSAEGVRDQAVTSAGEAKRRREHGRSGTGDEMEERGRWLRGVESTMKSFLEVEG